MPSWPIDKIEDHEAQSDARFTSQYDAMPALKRAARLWAGRMQQLENATNTLLTKRWLDDAEGEQLDQIGAVVGEARLERGDESYRSAILARIAVNTGAGDAPTIISYVQQSLGSGDVRLTESKPATWVAHIGTTVRSGFASQVTPLVAAGVGAYLTSADGALPFGHKEVGADDPDDVGGVREYVELIVSDFRLSDGSLLQLSDGDTLAVSQTFDPPISPQDGPRIAELYRASV